MAKECEKLLTSFNQTGQLYIEVLESLVVSGVQSSTDARDFELLLEPCKTVFSHYEKTKNEEKVDLD